MAELTRKELLMAVISGRGPAVLRGLDLSGLDLAGVGWLFDADLRETNLSHANLSRAVLRGARLENANLHAASIAGADLSNADLRRASLVVANLRMANLSGANLQGANLVGASLKHANLQNADMDGADLEGANLERADLRKARLGSANMKKVNLKDAVLDGAGFEAPPPDKGMEMTPAFLSAVGFSGSVGSIHLMDLVQLLCLSRSNLAVRLNSVSGHGSIHIRKGEICHAETGTLAGEDAFSELMRWKGGRFETLALPEEVTVTIQKPLEHLLVESLRRYDETVNLHHDEKAALLVEILRHVPLDVRPTEGLLDLVRRTQKDFDSNGELKLLDSFYSSENGEILCSIAAGDVILDAPLRLIELSRNDHPLYEKIADYQQSRIGMDLLHHHVAEGD